jgi:IS5 family transposase
MPWQRVRAVITTPANESDIVHLEDVIEKVGIEKGSRALADNGYCSQGNRNYLNPMG